MGKKKKKKDAAEAKNDNIALPKLTKISVTTEGLAKDLINVLNKIASIPNDAKAAVYTTFHELLYGGLAKNAMGTTLDQWLDMGHELSAYALVTNTIATEINVLLKVAKLEPEPQENLPTPIAQVKGTTANQ